MRLSLSYLGYVAGKDHLNKNILLAGLYKNVSHPRDPGGAFCSQDLRVYSSVTSAGQEQFPVNAQDSR